MDLGWRIRKWRDWAGLTQAAVAERLGVNRTAVMQWECGRTHPTQANLSGLVGTLGLTMERFYGKLPKARRAEP